MLDVEVTYETVSLDAEGIVSDLLGLLQTPRTYRAIGYLFSKLFVGTVSFALLATAGSLSVGLLLAPVVYDHPDVAYQMGGWQVETLLGATLLFGLGVVALLASMHLLNLWGRLSGTFAATMLGSDTADDPSTE